MPAHLRDAHYRSASTIGHGQGYEYPHDHPGAHVDQEYRPAAVAGTVYYEPSDRGHEAIVAERLRHWRDGGGGAAGTVPAAAGTVPDAAGAVPDAAGAVPDAGEAPGGAPDDLG